MKPIIKPKNIKSHKKPVAKKLKQKLERGNLFSDACPSRTIMGHVTSKWGLLVLLALSDGETLRFSDLRKKIVGISEKMLTQTLKALEADGFIRRHAYPVVPPYVEYQLTDIGLEIADPVINLAEWIEENLTRLHHG